VYELYLAVRVDIHANSVHVHISVKYLGPKSLQGHS